MTLFPCPEGVTVSGDLCIHFLALSASGSRESEGEAGDQKERRFLLSVTLNEVADFISELKFNLLGYRGHLDAAMASEATQKAVRGNMHMVIEIADFKS